ncbi:MAG: N-acetylmuramoyl-L-alanine amidase [Thiohalomonadaceae bacterium]
MPIKRSLLALLLMLFSAVCWAQASITGVRISPEADTTRLVFDSSASIDHRLFILQNPDRVVIDIRNASMDVDLSRLDVSRGLLNGIRSARQGPNNRDLRVVLDLQQSAQPRSFNLSPNQEFGHRLVIDLSHARLNSGPAAQARPATTPVASPAPAPPAAPREIIIVIDAGHGGKDPGAIGPSGTREKDVVLAIARRLQQLIDREPGFKAVMIRDGDHFISLHERVNRARRAQADLMLSIHADAFHDRRARGLSVYTLSARGATSEQARLLAERENASDLVGGVKLDDKDNLLASVLLDLSQTASIEASTDAAGRVLAGLKRVGRVHKPTVEQAGFRVLRAPDIPSMLIETGFISNPEEERNLRSSAYQQRLADAMLVGIRDYFRESPPPGTILAQQRRRQHIASRGDTLSGIARQYQVSMDRLREANNLNSNQIRVGQVIRIPSDS